MDEVIAAEFAEWGVTIDPEDMDEVEVFEIWDINVAAFNVFQALDTQWRTIVVAGMAEARLHRTGLDYPGVEVVMRAMGLPFDQFPLIQAMEEAALAAYAEVGR